MLRIGRRFLQMAVAIVPLLSVVAFGLGCGAPTVPGSPGGLTFQAVETRTGTAPAGATSPPTIAVDGSGVLVLGLFSAPSPCQVPVDLG
jgi:hypothetical protein